MVVRLVLVLWGLLVLGLVVTLGERTASLADVVAAADSGFVSSFDVAGSLPSGSTGWTTQDVRWRQGSTTRHAAVLYASPGQEREATDSNPSSGASVTTTDVATLIREHDPSARVRVSDHERPSSATVMRLEVPAWLWWVVVGGCVVALLRIRNGPEPWRATRWAWAWATFLTGPLGAVAFAVLSGPSPIIRAPRPGARRLTGGWSFLLMLVLSGSLLQAG